jgi:hypothetical protein
MSAYFRGSEWRKWDLHIHSNASDGHSSPSEIIGAAKEKELSVIAITDHHTVKNIDKVKELGSREGITVISGIEFRTEYGSQSVHMIGLFPDKYNDINLTQGALHDLILAKLGLSETAIIAKGKEVDPKLDNDAAFKTGMFRMQVDFKTAAALIHSYGGIVTVHAGNKTNSIEEMKHDGSGKTNVDSLEDSLGPVKEELFKEYIDVCEINKCSESKFYFEEFGRPSIAASDAHAKGEIGRKYSWIKANPSFDGLIQIKYEPDTRIRIQEEQPDMKPGYTTIDYVEIRNRNFSKTNGSAKVFLNPNLTSIIGGKSTGKSLLLNNIAYAIDSEQVIQKYNTAQPESKKKDGNNNFIPLDGFVVHWADGHESSFSQPSNKKIVYIPQTYLNRLSDEKEETTEIDILIKEILLQDDGIKAHYEKCQINVEQLKKDTDKLIYDYIDGLKKARNSQEQLLANNDSDSISTEIAKLDEERKKYILGTEITEEQTLHFSTLSEELQTLKTEQLNLNHDKGILSAITNVFIQQPIEFKGLQSFIKDKLEISIAELQTEVNKLWNTQKTSLISTIDARLEAIILRTKELEKDIAELRPIIESNATFISISEKIVKEKGKLQEAQKTEKSISEQIKEMSSLLSLLMQNITKYHDYLSEYSRYVNEEKNLKIEGLEFKLDIVLRADALKNRLLEVLNNKTLSRFKDFDIPKFDDTYYTEEHFGKLITSIQKNNSTSLELKSQYSFENILRELLSNWYNINYVVTMDNDDFEKMSPGKKALVLLKLLIGLTESDCPMLIDQPEDDLDNRSIFDDLVKYIKGKKIERQMIIVTHNANIVVGADSEEIIVANQHGQNTPNRDFKFEYISGAIEDNWIKKDDGYVLSCQGIQEHICEILEGGKSAFDKRSQKYNFIRES